MYYFVILDDENSHVHGVLTTDNLFDGTITTNFEDFYIEPSQKYSNQLHKNGIHTIVYKLSDVKMHFNNSQNKDQNIDRTSKKNNIEHCASEKLYRKFLKDRYDNHENLNENSDNHRFNYIKANKHKSKKVQLGKILERKRRWLSLDEVRKSIILCVLI